MKNVWVLSVKSLVLSTAKPLSDIPDEIIVFENFSDARDKMRECMKAFYRENTMFDSEGKIRNFSEYTWPFNGGWYFGEGDAAFDKEMLEEFHSAVRDVLSGKEASLSFGPGEYFGTFDTENNVNGLTLTVEKNGAMLTECKSNTEISEDYIYTNAFSMEEEKDYCLVIKDLFGTDEKCENISGAAARVVREATIANRQKTASLLSIQLKKTEIA